VSDEEVFAATYRAMQRLGPGELTLADIGREAGVTAGALVSRFGSKRALLLALARGAGSEGGNMVRALWREHGSPMASIFAYAECMGALASSPAALARNLAYLQIDLSDAEFREHLMAHARSAREALEEVLVAAVETGELSTDADPAVIARILETTLSGALITWATYREGTAGAWVRGEVEAVLRLSTTARAG
jgi:AcrR family transcriptional regulator